MRFIQKITVIALLFLMISRSITTAQEKFDKSFYGGLFYLTEYIASNEFKEYSKNHQDLESVDHIYQKALSFFEGDKSETFFCLAFTFLPYNHIDMRLPLLGVRIRIPLPSPPKKVFAEKLKNTPKKLFFDSPRNDFGDKDKLAHFFANAFLKYDVSFFNLSEFLGIFVEYIEQGFFVQGGYDNRDLVANHLGEIFAVMAKNSPNAKPSDALKVYELLYIRIHP